MNFRKNSGKSRAAIRRAAPFIAALGIVFLANAVQTFGENWLGQVCPYPGPCFRPEWLAIGIALSVAAYFAWRKGA